MAMAIIVHGGAGNIAPDRVDITRAGCKEAATIGWRILQNNGTALDAVEAAVRTLEDNPHYNAGIGSCLAADGRIEMDAGIMEGHTLNVGAVASVELIKNPILLARRVLQSPHVLLVSQGAQQFAVEQGMFLCRREDLLTQRQYEQWLKARGEARGVESRQPNEKKHGTVGAVALDQSGRLAVATSTGGFTNKHPGRVGDSSLVGCGFYADENAAISCTGQGEDFIRLLIAKRAADLSGNGASAREASEQTIAFLGEKAQGTGGLTLLDRRGDIGLAWNSPQMVHAYITSNLGMQEPEAGI